MSAEERARDYEAQIKRIIYFAEQDGISIRVSREPLQPLAMGHARHVVDAWPARHQPAPPAPRPMSDREWAALPANLRDGCTVHVPGVGDL